MQFNSPPKELLYFNTLIGFIMIMHKGVYQEVQWINQWDINTLSGILDTGKGILCFGIDIIMIRHGLPFLLPPSYQKYGILR